jgi:Arc/MetJ-type ribon-helix-helix transcriptional regulator
MAPRTTAEAVTTALAGVDFPADKDALVSGAERNNADADTVGAIRGVQSTRYENVSDVVAAVDLTDEDRETAEQLRAQRRTQHTHSGLSESEKDVEPVNPIAEELGTNRKK